VRCFRSIVAIENRGFQDADINRKPPTNCINKVNVRRCKRFLKRYSSEVRREQVLQHACWPDGLVCLGFQATVIAHFSIAVTGIGSAWPVADRPAFARVG